MRIKALFTILSFLISCLSIKSFAQQTAPIKKIIVTVTNLTNGKPVEYAEVTFKGFLLKKTKPTDRDGKVTYDVPLFGESQIIDIQVKNPASGKDYTTSVTLIKAQNIYDVAAYLTLKDTKKLTVTVTDQINNSVGGARVEIGNLSGYTQANGIIVFENVPVTGNFYTLPLSVTKPGFGSYKESVTFDESTNLYNVPVNLLNDKSYKKVWIYAVGKEDGKPIVGAKIIANGSYSCATGENGSCTLIVTSPGNLEVVVSHENFFSQSNRINIQELDDDKTYSLQFSMRKKDPGVGGVIEFYVKDKDLNPLNYAYVTSEEIGFIGGMTDANGYVKATHKFKHGEVHTIKAEKSGYKSQSKTIKIGSVFTPVDMEIFILEPGVTGLYKFSVRVLDHETNKPVQGAHVELKSYSGKKVGSSGALNNGIIFFEGPEKDVATGQFRLIAGANDYEDKWSDMSPEMFKSTDQGNRTIDIYLTPKKTANRADKKYGPFPVTLNGWTSTGLKFKRGGTFRTEVTGKMTSLDDKGQPQEMSPDGWGHWKWFALKGQIGKSQKDLGSIGDGYADEDGTLELGAPRVWHFFPDDAKGSSGKWDVYVYTRDAVEEFSGPADTNPLPENNNSEGKAHLAFLKELLKGQQMGSTSPADLAEGVRSIVIIHKLQNVQKYYNFETGLMNIKRYHEYFSNRMGSPTETEIKQYQSFLSSIISELESLLR